MRRARRLAPLALAALLFGAAGHHAGAQPLPSACDTLRALPAELFGGKQPDFQTTQDRTGNDVWLSMCTGLGEDELPAVTLLLRQDVSSAAPQPAPAQRDAMLADLAETFGEEPDASFPEIGEAAMWVADIRQLTVWYHEGRVMFIATAAGADAETARNRAEQIAREIVNRFP